MTDQKAKLGFFDTMGLFAYGFTLMRRMTPGFLLLAFIRSFITAVQPLAVLFFSARIVNELSGGGDVRAMAYFAAATVGLTFAVSVSKAFLSREINDKGDWEKAYNRLQVMEAERFTKMDYAYAEDGKLSEMLARMDTQAMGNGLGLLNYYNYFPQTMESLFSLAFSCLLLTGWASFGQNASLSQPYTWGLYALFAVGLLVTVRYRAKERAMLEKVYAENAKGNTAAGFYHKYIGVDQAAKDVRLYDQSAPLLDIFRDSFNVKVWISFFMFEGRIDGFGLALLAVVSGGFYLLTGLDALNGAAPIGSIVQNVGAVTALAGSVGVLVSMCGQMYNNAAFLQPMREFMALPDLLAKGNKPVPDKGEALRFEFVNVSFRYPGEEAYALRDLNLKLETGRRLAVVGLNGSGKTTMIKLLCRLYDPTEGEILLNGVNVKEYDYDAYIALFSVVFQDYALFPIWLSENVAAGKDYDRERVIQCLRGAGFGERLETLPHGLDTILYKSFDEEGTQISGGEAQKIALARALYKDAPMVVLDEPTAALDPMAEYAVYTTFDQTIGDKTAVFISHRLSSCRFCHDIAVFDGGRLVQRGSHEALLKDALGRYRELWDAQARHYNDEKENED